MERENRTVKYQELYRSSLKHLQTKRAPLFLTTSNRWSGEKGGEQPKSTMIAQALAAKLPHATLIDVTKLNIHPCEGNVSTQRGNSCGVMKARLKDAEKNPSGHHRCWASINNKDDELWKISKVLLESDCVVFFGSVRWGQVNSFYQKLIERLTWLENRHSTLGESNLLERIEAGIILVGQNWHGADILETQKKVLGYYGFTVNDLLCWNWQYTEQAEDEQESSYQDAAREFADTFLA